VLLNLRQGGYLDLFYKERTSPREKELFWAGDGIQIFVQLLWHLHRAWGASTVVLDEPEVFLHADLQRRLVKILSEMPAQTIVATHSSEIISEAPASSIIWVSKERRRAVPAPDPSVLEELSTSLGSGFNLRLARALRAKVAVFVEGEDMKILRVLAATVGATAVATEAGVVVESFGGYTKRASARAFAWLTDNLLGKAVHCFVVLDSDYRPPEVMQAAKKELEAVGAVPKAWKRKELESYLLVPSAIGRLAGASEAEVRQILDDLAQELRVKVVTRFQREFEDARHPRSLKDRHQVLEDAMTATEAVWGSFESRIARCPAKDLIRGLNRELASRGFKTMSTEDIAMELSAAEIPDEMRLFLLHVEHTARATDGEDE
jgi:predicted ATP-dependent endonuclease of OLD family